MDGAQIIQIRITCGNLLDYINSGMFFSHPTPETITRFFFAADEYLRKLKSHQIFYESLSPSIRDKVVAYELRRRDWSHERDFDMQVMGSLQEALNALLYELKALTDAPAAGYSKAA